MRPREVVAWLTLAALAVVGVVVACNSPRAAARPAPPGVPVIRCVPDQSPACAAWQDTSTSQVVQDLELFDRNGAPIWWCNNAGGCWVGNDKMGVTGASVFDLAAYLSTTDGTHGELVIDGQVLTGKDIAWIHAHGG